ncbi:hypothetical protein EV561_1401 [Rhizobium sp. BK376]|nr:hypothetical protein EV561_1401 [Rhizobium sp. BK376]
MVLSVPLSKTAALAITRLRRIAGISVKRSKTNMTTAITWKASASATDAARLQKGKYYSPSGSLRLWGMQTGQVPARTSGAHFSSPIRVMYRCPIHASGSTNRFERVIGCGHVSAPLSRLQYARWPLEWSRIIGYAHLRVLCANDYIISFTVSTLRLEEWGLNELENWHGVCIDFS